MTLSDLQFKVIHLLQAFSYVCKAVQQLTRFELRSLCGSTGVT